ncbi:hypothetical protein [Aquibacillus koreensis]|nr:hypothetical protein [Aquibacillus koreensis]
MIFRLLYALLPGIAIFLLFNDLTGALILTVFLFVFGNRDNAKFRQSKSGKIITVLLAIALVTWGIFFVVGSDVSSIRKIAVFALFAASYLLERIEKRFFNFDNLKLAR